MFDKFSLLVRDYRLQIKTSLNGRYYIIVTKILLCFLVVIWLYTLGHEFFISILYTPTYLCKKLLINAVQIIIFPLLEYGLFAPTLIYPCLWINFWKICYIYIEREGYVVVKVMWWVIESTFDTFKSAFGRTIKRNSSTAELAKALSWNVSKWNIQNPYNKGASKVDPLLQENQFE